MKDEHAFPVSYDHMETGNTGMSLRDYFAAAALTGLYAGKVYSDAHNWAAEAAYKAADAMLKARLESQG